MSFLLKELTGKRPLLPPTMPMTPEVRGALHAVHAVHALPMPAPPTLLASLAAGGATALSANLIINNPPTPKPTPLPPERFHPPG